MVASALFVGQDVEEVASRVQTGLKGLNYEASVSDLVAVTGIPPRYIEDALQLLARRYRSSCRVSEVGEIIHRFPEGFHQERKERMSLRSILLRVRRRAAPFASRLFKQWLLFLLAGYSAVFLAFLFPPVLVVFAILLGSWCRGDTLRLYKDEDYYRYRVRAATSYTTGSWRPVRDATSRFPTPQGFEQAHRRSAGDVLFDYLFGDVQNRRLQRRELLSLVLAFLREHRGVVSSEEIMIITGMTHEDAERYVLQLLCSYRGEPVVTARGTVVYDFADFDRPTPAQPFHAPISRSNPLLSKHTGGAQEKSPKNLDRTITAFNIFNLFFGVYYATMGLEFAAGNNGLMPVVNATNIGISSLFGRVCSFMAASHFVHAAPAILLVFGIVPVGIAVSFFALHLAALRREARSQRELRENQQRRQIYSKIISNPTVVDPANITNNAETGPGGLDGRFVTGVLDELTALYGGEIEDLDDEHYVYAFQELRRQLDDVERVRATWNDREEQYNGGN